MRIEDLERNVSIIDLIDRDYPGRLKRISDKEYRLNPCPVCGKKDHFTIYTETNSYCSFNNCCIGGSIFKYLTEIKDLSNNEARRELEKMNNIYKDSPVNPTPTKARETELFQKDYNKILSSLYNTQDRNKLQYLYSRGIESKEVIEKHKLFIGNIPGEFKEDRLIIPYMENETIVGYNARALNDDIKPKYRKARGMRDRYLNIDYIDTLEVNSTLILTEGEIDALSLEELGFKSISIGGSNNIDKILRRLKESKAINKYTVLVAFDNDDPGGKATDKSQLQSIEIPSKYKDINDWYLSAGRENVKRDIGSQIERLKRKDKKPNTNLDYLKERFIEAIEQTQIYSKRKTGFNYLDEKLMLLPGLYTLGGASGLGKTTLAYQIADQLAEQGEEVIFFSLEMGQFEMVSKSISRNTVLNNNTVDTSLGVSASRIRINDIPNHKRKNLTRAIKEYTNTSDKVSIIEGNFNTNVLSIRDEIKTFIYKNNKKPFVIIDYLQMISGTDQDRSEQDRIDNAVVELKRISRDLGVTILTLSSLNRANYMYPLAFESFKGSGGIEFTSDVVLGLQLQVLSDDDFIRENNIVEKRKMINDALKEQPRKVELIGLKNRNGTPGFNIKFDYYSKYDLFIEQKPTIDFPISPIGGRL